MRRRLAIEACLEIRDSLSMYAELKTSDRVSYVYANEADVPGL